MPTIRPATLADAAAIAGIYNHAVLNTTATWDEAPHSAERRERWLESLGETECVLVAEEDGMVAGWVSLTAINDRSGWRFTRSESVYVHPDYQRRGLGRALLGAILEQAKACGLRSVTATITSDNHVSMALHQAMGFDVRGELREAGYKFGRWLDVTYLQRML